MVFLDSCIVIDYINGRLDISDGDKKDFCINSIVDMEICIGARNKRELNSINKKISEFMSIDIDQGIMNLSVQIINEYNLSHDMTIYDAVIAATCMVYDLPLWTHNKKDFKFLDVSLE